MNTIGTGIASLGIFLLLFGGASIFIFQPYTPEFHGLLIFGGAFLMLVGLIVNKFSDKNATNKSSQDLNNDNKDLLDKF